MPWASSTLKDLVLNATKPVVLRTVLPWELPKWDLNKWNLIVHNQSLPFRCGKNIHTELPQFETTTTNVDLTFQEFVKCADNEQQWFYFDYKYLREWFTDNADLKSQINWEFMGFAEAGIEESAIWLGSKGAHTPCHIDSYGCNIVAQVYGRKRWMLFPPNENLHATRIPYEESSVYSKINFFSPNIERVKGIDHCHHVILQPGDVLIVPHGWWHYVENLDLAISINMWIPLKDDCEKHLEEAITQTVFVQFCKTLSQNERKAICNPSSTDQNPLDYPLGYSCSLIRKCIQNVQENRRISVTERENCSVTGLDMASIQTDASEVISPLSYEEFQLLCREQRNRFTETEATALNSSPDEELLDNNIVKILEAVLDGNVINVIKENLLKNK